MRSFFRRFSREKRVPFSDINTLLINLSKTVGVSAKDLSPYVILMQWGTYALLWDLQYNVRAFQSGKAPVPLPGFLKGDSHRYPEIVMEHLLVGHIRPNPRWARPQYYGFLYKSDTNEYWKYDSPEALIDPTNLGDKDSIYHEMYHAYQDAIALGPVTLFETERDAHFVGWFSAIKAMGFNSEEEMMLQFSPEAKASMTQEWEIGKKTVEMPLPPQASFGLAAYHFIKGNKIFEKYQQQGEEIIRKREGFAQRWRLQLEGFYRLREEAMRLFPRFPLPFTRDQLSKIEKNIEKIAQEEAGLNVSDPEDLEQWHQILANRLNSMEPEIKQMGEYDRLGYEERALVEAFQNYFTLSVAKYSLLAALAEQGERNAEEIAKRMKAFVESPLSRYSPHFFETANNNWVGPPKIKLRSLQGSKTEQFLLKLVSAKEGLFDLERDAVYKLAEFCDREKIPLNHLYQVAKNMPENVKKKAAIWWKLSLIMQWHAYSLMYATFKKWDLFGEKALKKIPPDTQSRWNKFKENILPLIKSWKISLLEDLPSKGIYYDTQKRKVRVPLNEKWTHLENIEVCTDLLNSLYRGYLVLTNPEFFRSSHADAEFFFWWLVTKKSYKQRLPGENKKTSKKNMEIDILKHLRSIAAESKELSPAYQALATGESEFLSSPLPDDAEKLHALWNKVRSNFSIVAFHWNLEKSVAEYHKKLASFAGLSTSDPTLRWSGVLKKEWNRVEKLPDDYRVQKYCLIVIINLHVSYWNLLGLPHDFQDIDIPNPEVFFKKHILL